MVLRVYIINKYIILYQYIYIYIYYIYYIYVKLQLLATTAMPNCHVSASVQEHSSFLNSGAMRLDRLWVWPYLSSKTGLGGWALWSD